MMTTEDLLKAAWVAILREDYAERDRLCALAGNLMAAHERIKASGNDEDVVQGEPIKLPGAQ